MHKYFTIFLIVFLNGCTYLPEIPSISSSLSSFSENLAPKIYKKDIKQGVVIRKNKFDLLKVGMKQDEILELIGSPSITDPFHNQEWEYIHFTTLNNNEIMKYRLTLYFENGLLIKKNIVNQENISSVEKYNIDLSIIEKSPKTEAVAEEPWYFFW